MPANDTIDNSMQLAGLHALEQEIEKKELFETPSPAADFAREELEDSPSEDDLKNLRRVADSIPKKVFLIAFVELCERFSYYGTTAVLTNYIQQPLPEGSTTGAGFSGQSGALGRGQPASTGIITFNQFWQYTMPLFGSYLADEHWGRFKTVNIALAVDIFGHLLLVLGAIPPIIVNDKAAMALLILGLIIIGFGTGCFKPNVSPLIVEQLDIQRLRVRTLPSGERIIVDPIITVNRIYNWFYLFINLGSLVGQVSMVFAEKYVGFYLSFVLPTVMLMVAPFIFLSGHKSYNKVKPAGSVLGPALKTWFLAQKGRWSFNPIKTWKNLHEEDFWEKVKPSSFAPGTKPSWMKFDDAWVDELKRGFAACAVFTWYPIYWLAYNQLNTNLISQAATMNVGGLPNEITSNLDPLALIIFIPICDFVLYPALRRFKINFTPIRRITLGFFFSTLSMVWAAAVQHYIYQQSECGKYASGKGCEPVHISVWAQSGAYVFIALSEIFASITSLEYAYSKAPSNMRSMVQAIALFTVAFASAIGQAWTSLSRDPLLVWNYGSIAIISGLAGAIFWIQFRDLDKKEDALNQLSVGHVYNDSPMAKDEKTKA